MKNKQLTNAYIALTRMGNMQFPLPVTYKLFVLRNKFKESFDFYAEQEAAIMERNGGQKTYDGIYHFENEETTKAVYEQIKELNDMEVEIAYTPVEVTMTSAATGVLSMNDIEALDGIVVFK